jgi:peptidoglycan/xylan/chitin deacetylase (PgdA/CDA1 family)
MLLAAACAIAPLAGVQAACSGTVYLTLDTGSMRDAVLIADILARQQVKATFFLANERTPEGNFALDDAWVPFWRQRLAEGHAFGSHTYDHVYFRGEARAADGSARVRVRPQFGASAGRTIDWDAAAVCADVARVDARFRAMTGANLSPIWRAPGGVAPESVKRIVEGCGYRHVHWADAGFLGDELPSDRFPNDALVARALRGLRDGDILMAHLGIWSRKVPFAPALEPLIAGLKARGLCFATLREHPMYGAPLRSATRGG